MTKCDCPHTRIADCDHCDEPSASRPPTLEWMKAEIREVNEGNGWFDTERTSWESNALLHSEIAEAFEAYRQWGTKDATANNCASKGPSDSELLLYSRESRPCKPEGVGSELADILIRLLDTIEREQWQYDWIKDSLEDFAGQSVIEPNNFGCWIDTLHTLVVKDYPYDLLLTLIGMAEHYQIDLQAEFDRKLTYNRTRGYRHGNKRV